MQSRFHRTLAAAWILCAGLALAMMLAPSCTQIATTAAAADDPFAVLAAKPVKVRPQSEREVRIVRPDGTPAPDALVVFAAESPNADTSQQRRAAALRWPGDEPRQLAVQARDGIRLAVDARGCVQSPTGGRLFAFAGENAANRFVDDATSSLQLIPPHACTVEVMDEAGQPVAGAPLAVRSANGLLLGRHTTGSDGTRALRLLSSAPNATTIGLQIGSNAPIAAPLPASGGRVRLTMPKTTALTATFVGELIPRRALSFEMKCRALERPIPGELTGERSAVWPFVAIGTEATVTVHLSAPEPLGPVASAQATTTVTANAPALELGATFTSASIVLQVLDLAGQPAAHRAFTLRIQQGDERRLRHIRADAEGWIELWLPNSAADAEPATFVLDLHADAAETARAVAAGELPRTALREPGRKVGRAQLELQLREPVRKRLDPIRCQPMPVLAAGQLVLPDGSAPGTPLTLTTDGGLRVRTDEAGRFELRGEAPNADHEFERRRDPEDEVSRRKKNGPPTTTTRVEIERAWCFPGDSAWDARLPHGATDLRLVVQRCVAVPLHPELTMHDLTTLEFFVEPTNGRGWLDGRRLEWSGRTLLLPVGSWDLVVHAGNQEVDCFVGHGNDELMRWRNVRPDGAGGAGLAAIDWRPFARLVEVRIVDRDGQPIEGEVRLPGILGRIPSPETNVTKRGSVVRVLVPPGGTDLEVHCTGRASQQLLRKVQEDRTAVIEAEPQLRVRLQPAPKLPVGLQLELVLADGASAVFDEQAEAVVAFPGAGTFPATIRVRKDTTSSAPLDWQLPRLDVPKDGALIPIQITPERRRVLEAAVVELRDR
jgi:hypothetical protein